MSFLNSGPGLTSDTSNVPSSSEHLEILLDTISVPVAYLLLDTISVPVAHLLLDKLNTCLFKTQQLVLRRFCLDRFH
jgi:hypothetical protein